MEIVLFMKKLLFLIFIFSLTSLQIKSEQVENRIAESKFDGTKIAFWEFNNKDLNWKPPKEPKDLKEIRESLTSSRCKLNSFGTSSGWISNPKASFFERCPAPFGNTIVMFLSFSPLCRWI